MRARALCLAVAIASTAPGLAAGQGPGWPPRNLRHFPKEITRDDLTQRMREFSFALGVRCQYCHAGGDGVSFEGVEFASDEKPAKVKARAMLRMVDELNRTTLAALPARAVPRVEVSCATCHRGLPLPKTLQVTLYELTREKGAAAAAARYRQLRQDQTLSGRYNFGEWEINELARRLAGEKDLSSAIIILELNREFYPKSAEIEFQLGELNLALGNREPALAHFRAALERRPDHDAAKRRVAELEKK